VLGSIIDPVRAIQRACRHQFDVLLLLSIVRR
jgi:hypothetical protein